MAFNRKDLAEAAKQLKEQGELQEKLNSSAKEYAEHMNKIAELQKNITHINKTLVELVKEQEKAEAEIVKEEAANLKLNKEGKKVDEGRLRILYAQLAGHEDRVRAVNKNLKVLKAETKELETQAKSVSKMTIAYKESLKFLRQTPGLIKKGFGKLKGYGLFEMDKEIRKAGVSMGKMASVGSAMGQDIIKASTSTQSMGVHVKDLAKMQSAYSSELGRSVMLSQEGFEAMAQMANGTVLGAEGAARMAAEMDTFNVSARDTGKIVGDVTQMSETMGLNAGAVLKTLQKNLKMANKYHFKGGIEGMTKMAAQAEKFNMSMDTTAQFADKLFDIEGAVEMSAKLNTMGGEWAKLGDPMKLMFQARNDMEGLQTSVIDATAGMADFNSETGKFSFSGLELHRMRELEKITGISAEQMAEMAKSKAKFSMISGQLGMDVDDNMKNFIENSSVFEDGEYKIKISGEDDLIPIKELSSAHKKMMETESANLKERAINSQTFDDQLINMIENSKTLLLPLLKGMNKAIPDMIEGFQGFMTDTVGIAATVKSIAETAGSIIGGAIKLFMKAPVLITAIAAAIMGPGKWLINGLSLARGFMMGTKGMGGAGTLGGAGGVGSKTARATLRGKGASGKLGKFGKGMAGKGMGIGAAGMIGGMAMNYGREQLDDPDSDGGKAMGIAGSALSGAATGAMIGSVIPILGTAAGAIIGGLIGGLWTAHDEYGDKAKGGYDPTTRSAGSSVRKAGDIDSPAKGVTRITTKEGGIFDTSKRDDVVVSPGASKAMRGGSSTSNVNVKISFDTIMVKSDDGSSSKIDYSNDSAFISMLSTKIRETLTTNANGGVLSPNPIA